MAKKEKPDLSIFKSLTLERPIIAIVIFSMAVVGITDMTMRKFMSSTTIGSFYEKSEFEEKYSAALYIDGKAIPCIAEIWKEDGNWYRVERLYFPYGKEYDVDQDYYPGDKKNYIFFSDYDFDCEIVVGKPADEIAYSTLKSAVTSSHGDFCASKKSSKFHLSDCSAVKNIHEENLIYFESAAEALVLGFEWCQDCQDRY